MRRSSTLLFSALFLLAGCFKPPPQTTLSVDFSSPGDGQTVTFTDDVAPSAAGFQLDVVAKAADSAGNPVALGSAALQTRLSSEPVFTQGPAGQIAGDTVTFPAVNLPQGASVLQVSVTESGSNRTATRTITVNVQLGRPQVLTFRFQGDANNDAALNQAEQATGAPVALLTVQGVEDGQTVTVQDDVSGKAYGTGTVTAGAASVTLSSLPVTDTTEKVFGLVAHVMDKAGRDNVIANPTPSQPLNASAFKTLMVDRDPPELTILSPAVPAGQNPGVTLDQVDDSDATLAGFQVRVAIQTSPDVGANGVEISRSPGGTDLLTPDGVTYQASVDFTVPDAGPFSYAISVTVTDLAGNTAARTFTIQVGDSGVPGFFANVRFSDNTLRGEPADPFKFPVSRNVALGGSQSIVAVTNVAYWAANSPAEIPTTVIVDQDLTAPDAQVVVTGAVAGGATCTPKLLYNGSAVATGPVLGTNSPGPVSLSATLPSGTAGPLRFAVDCGGGKVLGPSTNLTVDVVPPSAVPATLTLVNTGTFSERRPALDVTWSPGNDDGAGGGTGTATGYEVRWGTNATLRKLISPAPSNLYDQRFGIDTDVRYFDPNRSQLPAGGSLAAGATSFRLQGLPAIEDYYVQVRARDDVGNLGAMVATNCSTGAGCLSHQLRLKTIDNPGTAGRIGYLMEAADLNGDGAADLVFTSNTTRTAWIAYGSSNPFTTISQVALPASALPVAAAVPYVIAVGDLGNAAGTTFPDLAVSDPTWDTFRGRHFLFFGRTGSIDPVPVELRGTAQSLSSGAGSGSSQDQGVIRIIGDFGRPGGGPPDGLAEVAISANNDNGGVGRVYLFYGRPHDPAASAGSWEALATATDPGDTGNRYIPLSAADRIFDGEAPPAGVTNAFFGVRLGYASLGDVTGDGVPDFTIPDSVARVNRLYVYSGAAVNGGGTSVPASARLQRIDEAPGADISWRGFGSFAVGGFDLIAGAARDLAVGYPLLHRVQIYADGSTTGFGTAPSLTIDAKTSSFGRGMAVADVNGDGQPDLVVATNACRTACGDGFAGGAWVFYNRRPSAPEYDLSTDDAAFSTTRLMKDFAVTSDSDALGLNVAAGDFNGDGIADVAVSDNLIPGTNGPGKIYVRY